MRKLFCLTSVLLLSGAAFGGGTVGFNVTWYPTPPFPFNDIVDPVQFESTTGVVIADFNRDGIPDVAYSYPCCEDGSSGGGVIVKLGTGGGKLGPDIFHQWGASTLAELATADINGDGWLDLVVRDVSSGGLHLLLNNGDGTFQWVGSIPGGATYTGSFTLGDFNHDGKIDVAAIGCDMQNGGFPFDYANCTLFVYLGDGTGNFTQSQSIQLATGTVFNLQSADINGDGILDLVYVRNTFNSALNQYTPVGVIRWGRGDGTFSVSGATYFNPPTTHPLDAVAIADFNNDGRLDVALLSGHWCHPLCGGGTADTVWMYKNNGAGSFTLSSHTKFAQHGGAIIPADINGDLNQDLIYYNPFGMGIYPVLHYSGGFDYALGAGNETLGTQGTLPNNGVDVAAAFREMDGDSRTDYAVIDWNNNQLGIGIQTGGFKNCPPPNSANLAAKICGIKNGATVTSPVLVKASGNSPVGVNQMQVWIDGKKQYVKWGDQLSKKFTLAAGKHKIVVVANDKFVGTAKTTVNVTVP